jgi:hypothetical protein
VDTQQTREMRTREYVDKDGDLVEEPIERELEEGKDAELPRDSSLASRMAARSEELARQTTVRFPIPGWEDILEVELRSLGYKTLRRAISANERIRDQGTREMYAMADQILMATVAFWEVPSNGTGEAKQMDETWESLAKRLPNCPDAATPRQALLFLVGDKRLHFLVGDWGEWAKNADKGVEDEVQQDFGVTG